MAELSVFFKQNKKNQGNVKFALSDNFVDDKGNAVEWELRQISADENDNITNSCMKRIPINGVKGQFQRDLDQIAYKNKLMVSSVVFPNLNDKDLQDSYGALSAESLLGKMLTAGESAKLINKIMEISDLRNIAQEDVEEAKN